MSIIKRIKYKVFGDKVLKQIDADVNTTDTVVYVKGVLANNLSSSRDILARLNAKSRHSASYNASSDPQANTSSYKAKTTPTTAGIGNEPFNNQ